MCIRDRGATLGRISLMDEHKWLHLIKRRDNLAHAIAREEVALGEEEEDHSALLDVELKGADVLQVINAVPVGGVAFSPRSLGIQS